MTNAVVLAGGTDSGELAAQTGVAHRPLLEVGGRPIIQRVLAALRGAVEVDHVALVAPEPVQAAAPAEAVDARVAAGESFVENVRLGIEAAAEGADRVLLLTGDLPLITPAAVNDFVSQSALAHAEITYPIIPRESCERAFPGAARTYVKLREGAFTGGNGVVVDPAFVGLRAELIERLYASRKHPLKLAALFGYGFVLRLAMGRLDLERLQRRASEIVGGRVAAIISPYAELGFDVDKMADLNLARQAAESFRLDQG